MDYLEKYFAALWDTDRERILDIVREAESSGYTPEDVIFKLVIPSIEKMIGPDVTHLSTTLSHHFLAAKIADELTTEMIKKFKIPPIAKATIVLGSSLGDFHGLGKKILGGVLRASMFNVIDVGINVPPEKFVAEAISNNASFIGISSMMVHTATGEGGAKKVRQLLQEKNLEHTIKIIVGGAPYRYDNELYKTVCADAWASSAPNAVKELEKLIEEMKGNKQ